MIQWLAAVGLLMFPVPVLEAAAADHAAPHHGATSPPQSEGTRRMVERLAGLREEASRNARSNPFLSTELAAFFQEELKRSTDEKQALNLRANLAIQLLQAGQSKAALKELDAYREAIAKAGLRPDSRQENQLSLLRALCYLRIGEQENCLSNHTSDSCLMPIRDRGVHQLPEGSRGAIEVLTQHLKRFSSDLRARWLLNLACMTLGEYPDKVPPAWLIPPRVFESEYDIKRFPDVAGPLGLDVDDLAGSGITEDFDGDGYLDVMASAWGLNGPLRYFRNNRDGTFSERTAEAGITGIVGGLHMMQTDYNNDGRPDVFLLRGAWLGTAGRHPNSLLRNEGNGTFADVTEEAGLLSFHPTQTATWLDFNGDGWLDVFIGNESWVDEIHPCELYRNNGDGTFTECATESGVAITQFIKGVTSGDYNNDGRPDLYLSNRSGPNILLRNEGPTEKGASAKSPWKFTDVSVVAGVTEPMRSFPTWFWDYNNDGWADIFVAGYFTRDVSDIVADYLGLPSAAEKARLYRNNGDGTFTDATSAAGLHKVLHAMGSNFGDLDNDGWLDFYVGTGDPDLATLVPNRMFRNADGRRFQEVTTSGGFGHIQKGHGVSFADLDNDGDQDIHIVMGGAVDGDNYRNAVFLNPGHGQRWITLKLEGVRSNRAAIGARIKVILDTVEGERSIYKTVTPGGSFGASPLRQEIGLGQARAIRAVEILWPVTGKTQTVHGLAMDSFYKIRENAPAAEPWKLDRLPFPSGTNSTPHSHHHHAALRR